MTARNNADWLQSFVDHASIGEAPLDLLWWVGVSTVAGALRRRVWIEQATFQWVPNFYIVAVAPPGIISKSTTANLGFRLLRRVDNIHLGPDITSWQALVQYMGSKEVYEEFVTPNGGHYDQSAVTCAIDEYGTFIDPFDRQQIDNLTALWDGKQGTIWKATKTQGHDRVHYPWFNTFACTTPGWYEKNFPESFLESGFIARHIFIHANAKRQLVAYPAENMPAHWMREEDGLVDDLAEIANYAGPFHLTRDAIEWGTEWYTAHWKKYAMESRERLGFPSRKQTHLHKLAMVISASRGAYPHITSKHLIEANERLESVEPGIRKVLGLIGSTKLTQAARQLVEALMVEGKATFRRDIFGKYFFRRLSNTEFEEALQSAIGAGYVQESADRTTLMLRKPLEY